METQPGAAAAIGLTVVGRVREEARRQGLTWRDLTERTGISRTRLARAFSGRRPLNLNELALFADALGVDVSALAAPTEPS
jgi:transcriptional regulator with XRE-family HTH domain